LTKRMVVNTRLRNCAACDLLLFRISSYLQMPL